VRCVLLAAQAQALELLPPKTKGKDLLRVSHLVDRCRIVGSNGEFPSCANFAQAVNKPVGEVELPYLRLNYTENFRCKEKQMVLNKPLTVDAWTADPHKGAGELCEQRKVSVDVQYKGSWHTRVNVDLHPIYETLCPGLYVHKRFSRDKKKALKGSWSFKVDLLDNKTIGIHGQRVYLPENERNQESDWLLLARGQKLIGDMWHWNPAQDPKTGRSVAGVEVSRWG
jgi:hypothetical protein